ncbi:peptide ABC transporter permease [Flavonifractor sp. An92]|uniref:oligopeptide ABC transporter permease n=1 Tax=Flavonifractor sp. An92 TaxID=1965666 RepID=UPI000B391CDC|nr:oligopeptide ABC transporter permease [Flavonifractor sp. An92]OUN06364.1 peptide ABC transporter permease [Flavonifractor sp. An92]
MSKFWERLRAFHGRGKLEGEYVSVANLSWRKFCRNRLAVFSLIVLVLIAVISFLAPLITPYSYSEIDLTLARQPPSPEHILGTDEYGRDMLTRLIYGGRVSMTMALAAMLLQLVIGVVLGCLAGYFGSWVDAFIMRLTDVFMCFPFYIMAVCLAAIVEPGLKNLVLIIGFLSWTGICRIVRAEILSLKENDYILAARSLGIRPGAIIRRHILPNILSPILVAATLSIAGGIMSEASMSFLNLGVRTPESSWGNMLSAAQSMQALVSEWWRWVPPGLMIVIVVLSINYVGEGLRNALDPRISN